MASAWVARIGTFAGIAALCLGAAACGSPPEPTSASAGGMELTWVGIDQYHSPSAADDLQQPSVRLVTGDVTLVFRYADHPTTLVVDFEGASGSRTHNELNLAELKPDIVEATDGRWRVLAPMRIPELGALQFSAVLVDQGGRASGAVGGSFTVLGSFSGSNGAQAAEGNTTTVTGGP